MESNIQTTPQPVVTRAGENAIMIVYKITDNESSIDVVKDLCADFAGMIRSMLNRFPTSCFNCTIAFGAEAWAKLCPELGTPKELETFKEIKGDKYVAVSTPGDIFLHIRANSMGLCHEFASIIDIKLGDAVESVDETHGFRYMDGKAIIGFVDGTENPAVDSRALDFAVVGSEDPEFEGGSYVFVQKYLHNMQEWNNLPVEEQEKVIGRRKFNDIELSDEEKPQNAHNKVTNIEDEDGNELKIIRANIPFGDTSKREYGTYFISYARSFSTTRRMLENMFIGEPKGNTDRLLDFSTAVTGNLFFAPSYEVLSAIGGE